MSRTLIPAAAILVSLPAAGLAASESAPRAIVPYGDLDLASPAGQKRLDTRARRAVFGVCPKLGRDLGVNAFVTRCRELAAAQADAQVRAAVAAATSGHEPARFAGKPEDDRS